MKNQNHNKEIRNYLRNLNLELFFLTSGIENFDLFKLEKFNEGSVIIKNNDLIDKAYFLLEGSCSVELPTNIGIKIKSFTFEAFDLIGFIEFITNQSRYAASVTCNTDCVFLSISGPDIMRLFTKYPAFERSVLIKIVERNFKKMELQIVQAGKTIEEKLIFYVTSMIPTNYFSKNKQFVLLEKRVDIATTLGCDVRSISRAITSLKSKNFITIHKQRICIDEKQLFIMKNL